MVYRRILLSRFLYETDTEENQIVLFLQTLSDGFFVPAAKFNDARVPATKPPPMISEGAVRLSP
jgi:hypothetical protein